MSLAHDGTILLTGAAGFIGYHLADRLLRDGCRVVGVDSLNDYYDPRLKQARLDRLHGPAGLQLRSSSTSPTAPAPPALFAAPRPERRRAPRGPGRRALLAGEPARLCRRQPRRASSTCSRAAGSTACAHLVYASSSSVYGANTQDAVLGPRQRRPSGEPLRRDQEGQRADGPHLQPPLRPAGDGPALLHRLRPVGPAGHGAVPVHQGDARGPADPGLQPRPDAARLHLHRRHRRGRAPGHRPSCRRRTRPGAATQPDPGTSTRTLPALQHRQPPAGRADAPDRDAGAGAGRHGGQGAAADAARRRAGDLRRHRRPRPAPPASRPRRRSRTASRASCAGTATSGCRSWQADPARPTSQGTL